MNNTIKPRTFVPFKSAQLNILATSDNHGNTHTLPLLAETVKNNKGDIFVKIEDKSTMNVFAIAGDWFINPSKKGFITNPELTNGDIQLKFLDKTIAYVKGLAGKNANFDTVFTMGNHDLDGGDKFMYKVMKKKNKKTLITNVDLANSPQLKEMMKKNENIVKSVVYEIPDDKDPDLTHKALFLGVTIPSMKFYNPGLLEKMSFYDDCNKKDAYLKKEDLGGTFEAVRKEVEKFKEENPKGAVILLSHTGAPISKMIRDEVPEIDVILNGHDHKNLTSLKGTTNINSLGKDNEIIKSLNIKFDDDGDIESIDMNSFFSKATLRDELDINPLTKFLEESFSQDVVPIVSLTDIMGEEAELQYSDSIRFDNSFLANYLTSAVKRSVRKVCNDKEVIVGIPSSIIRGGIKDCSSNLDLMKIFDGVSEDLSNVKVGRIKGEELVGLIVENVRDNLKAPKRNTLIQWSDVQVNRTLISEILSGKSSKQLSSAIKVRDIATNQFVDIDLEKNYPIAISEKFLIKDDIVWPGKIRDRFVNLNKTYDELFRGYISSDEVNYQLKVTQKTKEQRII